MLIFCHTVVKKIEFAGHYFNYHINMSVDLETHKAVVQSLVLANTRSVESAERVKKLEAELENVRKDWMLNKMMLIVVSKTVGAADEHIKNLNETVDKVLIPLAQAYPEIEMKLSACRVRIGLANQDARVIEAEIYPSEEKFRIRIVIDGKYFPLNEEGFSGGKRTVDTFHYLTIAYDMLNVSCADLFPVESPATA